MPNEVKSRQIIWIPQVVASLMLIVALNPDNPYGYYVLIRWVIFGIFAFLAFKALEEEKIEWVWILGITAAVYNPFIKAHLGRELWSIVNVLTVGIAVFSIFKLKGKKSE